MRKLIVSAPGPKVPLREPRPLLCRSLGGRIGVAVFVNHTDACPVRGFRSCGPLSGLCWVDQHSILRTVMAGSALRTWQKADTAMRLCSQLCPPSFWIFATRPVTGKKCVSGRATVCTATSHVLQTCFGKAVMSWGQVLCASVGFVC